MASSTGASYAAALRDRVVMVAGASGRIGGLVAQLLLEHGAKLALAVRRPWQVEKLRVTFGAPTLVGCVPSGDAEAAAGFVKGARDALGGIDALIVAIGACERAEVGKEPSDRARTLIEANYLVPALFARAVLPTLRRRNAGRIVFLGAREPERGAREFAPFLAAKAALHSFACSLERELAGTGVRIAVAVPDSLPEPATPDSDELAAKVRSRVAATLVSLAAADGPGAPPLFPLANDG